MKRLLVLLVVIFPITVFCQIQATTEDGKNVILKEDGTWEYITVPEETTTTSLDFSCDDLIATEVDKMTGDIRTSAKEFIVISEDGGKSGFGIYVMKGAKTSLILSIQAVGAGACIDDDDKMNILFRDGTRAEMINNGDFNCKGKFTQYFGGVFGNKSNLELMKSHEVETMRIWTSDGYVERDFTAEQSKKLMKTIQCLTE